jgi:lipopolysaccharide transport system ATP-binding protein
MNAELPLVEALELTKRYRLGVIGRASLQDELRYRWYRWRGVDPESRMGIVKSSLRHAATRAETAVRSGWITALDAVSFELRRGESLGLIGRNGSGKTTLLKLLSRVTPPTDGRALLRGRVGALLEVGTGFHPELTGRENIYLNGALLGMRRREIEARFEEIVAFADIGPFLDTPVKRYSSGMFVRLAFAVGAHLEPEILLVDEVLAVGDAAFQRKCLQRMQELGERGHAVIFVSHNMDAVRRLCSRALVLEQGRLVFDGPTDQAVALHLERMRERRPSPPRLVPESGVESVELVIDGAGTLRTFAWDSRQPMTVEFEIRARQPIVRPSLGFAFHRADGIRAFRVLYPPGEPADRRPRWRVRVRISAPQLAPGSYYADVHMNDASGHTIVHWPLAAQGEVMTGEFRGDVTSDSLLRPETVWEVSPPEGGLVP